MLILIPLYCSLWSCMHLESMDPFHTVSQTPPSAAVPYEGPATPEPEEPQWTAAPLEIEERVLNLADCLRIGVELNPRTQASWQSMKAAAARIGVEQSAYLPEVDFFSSASREKQLSFQIIQTGQSIDAGNLFDAGFGLSYLLFDGGARSARVDGSKSEFEAGAFLHNAALQDVALSIERSYYQLLAARWLLQVAEETVKKTAYHVRLANARYENGLVPRSDVLKAETEKADANLSLVAARNGMRIAEGALASAMGIKVSASIKIADIDSNAHAREVEQIDRLLDEATRNRPELRAAAAQIKARQASIKEATSQWWPRLNADAGYGWADDVFAPRRDEWAVGVSLSFPLFTGFKRGYQVQQAKRSADQAQADYQAQLRSVELEVWTAYSNLIEAGEAIEAAQSFVASAEESARLAEGEYKAGTGDIIALIDAQTALTTAQNRLVQARLGWYTARAQFERAVGRSLLAGS
jgi:outer membrane protein TolC